MLSETDEMGGWVGRMEKKEKIVFRNAMLTCRTDWEADRFGDDPESDSDDAGNDFFREIRSFVELKFQ